MSPHHIHRRLGEMITVHPVSGAFGAIAHR